MSRAQEILLVSQLHESRNNDYTSEEDDEEGESELGSDSDDTQVEEKDVGGFPETTSSNCYSGILHNLCGGKGQGRGRGRGVGILFALGGVLDPRASWVQEWNKIFLFVCVTGLFLDPLFFYALSISEAYLSLFVDGWFATLVTVLRCMIDVLHVWNMWLQFKMAKRPPYKVVSREGNEESTRAIGEKSVAHMVALGYIKARSGFFFDLFVILPLPQVLRHKILLIFLFFFE